MHYRDGTEAQLGDIAKGKNDWIGHEVIGEVVGLIPGADLCNLQVRAIARRPGSPRVPEVMELTCNAKEFELVSRAGSAKLTEGAKT